MLSAQHREIEEPSVAPATQPRADLHPLLEAIRSSNIGTLNSLHGRGRVLFAEGEPVRGVYILRTGRATVSISSSQGRVVMLRLAQAGDVLGLNSTVRNCPYDTTVKTLEPCRVDFIPRVKLIELMQQDSVAAHAILNLLSRELNELTDRAKLLLLPQTVSGRLGGLLLEWGEGNGLDNSQTVRLDKVLTHEEIGQMICSSRETVTRLLGTLAKQRVIHVTSDSIEIRDRRALEDFALG